MLLEEDIVKIAEQLADVTVKEEKQDAKTRKIFARGEKIVLVLWSGTKPLRIELRCDAKLADYLMEHYESVQRSQSLGRNGIEIICSGQLSDEEIVDLIHHSSAQAG